MRFTRPSRGARISFSIFIASTTTSPWIRADDLASGDEHAHDLAGHHGIDRLDAAVPWNLLATGSSRVGQLDELLVRAVPYEVIGAGAFDGDLLGRYRHALQSLADADRLAPEEVRYRPLAHRLIARLLTTQVGGQDHRLRHLANRSGVTS